MSMANQGYNEMERAFHEKDAEWLKARRAELDAQRKAAHAKAAHGPNWMKCPKCAAQLKEKEILGVMVDHCTGCGGIYLDKGELELIARADGGGISKLLTYMSGL
jgi:hypothetical protein